MNNYIDRRIALIGLLALVSCAAPDLPDPGSSTYQEVVTAFYSSVASVQSGEDAGAEQNLLKVADLAPGEPAAWYNLGLIALRQNDFDEGQQRLLEASRLAPENVQVQRLIAMMELAIGNMDEGILALRKTLELDGEDVKALFALAQELGRTGDQAPMQEALSIYESLSDILPDNLVVLVEKSRLAAQLGSTDILQPTIASLKGFSSEWPEEVQEPFIALEQAAGSDNSGQALVQAGFLRNMLLSTYAYRQDLLEVQTPY